VQPSILINESSIGFAMLFWLIDRILHDFEEIENYFEDMFERCHLPVRDITEVIDSIAFNEKKS